MSRRFSSRQAGLGVGEGALYTIFRRMCDLFHGEKGHGFRLARNAHGLQRMQRNGAVQRVGGTLLLMLSSFALVLAWQTGFM